MPSTETLFLVTQTRNEEYAGSSDRIRLLSNGMEVARFGYPAGPGFSNVSIIPASLDVDSFLNSNISLAVTSDDAWAPRTAFLFGTLKGSPDDYYVPLAQNLQMDDFGSANPWISQDLSEGKDRWSLGAVAEADENGPLDSFLVIAQTMWAQGSQSSGPIQLSVFGNAAGLPVLVYQTALPTMGNVGVGTKFVTYMTYLPVRSGLSFSASQLISAQITNLSDDAWKPRAVLLFGLSSGAATGRFLGESQYQWWLSQDPTDVPAYAWNAADPSMTILF